MIHTNYDQARKRYGPSVADVIRHGLEKKHGAAGKKTEAKATEQEDARLSQKPKASEVRDIIDRVIERS